MKTNTLRIAAVAALAFVAASAAQAQAGTIVGRVGFTRIMPQVDSGSLTAPSFENSQINIRPNTQLSGGITYFVDDHLAIDLPLALPFKHDVVGAGAVSGVGKIAEVQALPVTLLAQYYFLEPSQKVRPFVGGGLTYAKFFKERTTAVLSSMTGGTPSNPTTMEVDPKLGVSLQAGASWRVTERVSLEACLIKTWIKTTAHLSSGQSIDFKINPYTFSLGVGYKF